MELNDDGSRRRRGKLLAAGAGLVALVALTAGAVIAFGPSPSGHAAAADTPATVSPTASSPAAATAAATGSAAPEPTGSADASPAGATGQVKNGVHTGDLRYFLMTPPDDADVYGDAAGSPYTVTDIVAGAKSESDARAALTTYGFRSGAYRTYLTGDGVYEIGTHLIRFHSQSAAAAYYTEHYYDGTKISLGEDYPARAYRLTSSSAESTNAVAAVSYQGDVQITITVTGSSTPSRALLRSLVDAQHQRLMSGH